MVNGAWSGQLEVEFLLQVFTIVKQVGFRISLHRSSERSAVWPPQAGRRAVFRGGGWSGSRI